MPIGEPTPGSLIRTPGTPEGVRHRFGNVMLTRSSMLILKGRRQARETIANIVTFTLCTLFSGSTTHTTDYVMLKLLMDCGLLIALHAISCSACMQTYVHTPL